MLRQFKTNSKDIRPQKKKSIGISNNNTDPNDRETTMDFTSSNNGPKIGAAIPHASNVTSLSYHSNGEQLFAATESDSRLYMINALEGQCTKQPYKSERDGVSVVSATYVLCFVLSLRVKIPSEASSCNIFVLYTAVGIWLYPKSS